MKKLMTLLIFAIGANIYSQTLENGLFLYLPFGVDTVDESGNNNKIEVFGAELTTDRFYKDNSAYYFDGLDDYIEIFPNVDLSNLCDFTISVWFKLFGWEEQPLKVLGLLDQQYVFDGHAYSSEVNSDYLRDGINIVLYLKDDYETFIRNTTYDLEGNYIPIDIYSELELTNGWFNNVFVRQNNTTFHYLNGKLIAKKINDGICLDMSHKLYLGTFSGNNPNYNSFNYNFHGKIDDLRFYNKALDSIDIAHLYYGTCGIDNVIYDSISVTDTLIIDVVILNVNDIEVNRIKIYPNPAKDFIIIDNGSYELMNYYSIKIVDIQTKVVFESKINSQLFEINVNDFGQEGLFLIQILNSNNEIIETKKILLE